MKKLNEKGFMLTETLIVSTMLITVLLAVYVQFKNIVRNYENSFTYNTVNDIYSLYSVKDYLEEENYAVMADTLDLSSYLNLSDCNIYFNNKTYCKGLLEKNKIKYLILTKLNMEEVQNENMILSEEFTKYVKSIKTSNDDGYRIIAEFNDKTFATLKIFIGDSYKSVIRNVCSSYKKVDYKIHYIEDNSLNVKKTIKDDTVLKDFCGTTIDLKTFNDNKDECLFLSKYQITTGNLDLIEKANLVLSSNDYLNSATLVYDRYKSNIVINFYDKSETSIQTQKTIEEYCGQEHYIKDIAPATINGKNLTNGELKFKTRKGSTVIKAIYE